MWFVVDISDKRSSEKLPAIIIPAKLFNVKTLLAAKLKKDS